jgi:hypothetical protein
MLDARVPTTLNIAVRVEFMARHVPSQAGNETREDYETHFVRLLYLSILAVHGNWDTHTLTHSHASRYIQLPK